MRSRTISLSALAGALQSALTLLVGSGGRPETAGLDTIARSLLGGLLTLLAGQGIRPAPAGVQIPPSVLQSEPVPSTPPQP